MNMNERLRIAATAFDGISLRDSIDLIANILKYLVVRELGLPNCSWLDFGALTVDMAKTHSDTLALAAAQQANLMAYWLSVEDDRSNK